MLRHGLIRGGVAHVAELLPGHGCANAPVHTETGRAVSGAPTVWSAEHHAARSGMGQEIDNDEVGACEGRAPLAGLQAR